MQKIILRRLDMPEKNEKADVFCFLCKAKLPTPEKGEVKCLCCKVTYTNIGKKSAKQ